jgi:hypothetical protein
MKQKTIYIKTINSGVDNTAKNSVLKVLAYFDVFHYPLTKNEIVLFSEDELIEVKLDGILNELQQQKIIFCYEGFYSLHNNPLLIHRRRQGNIRAAQLLKKATSIGRFLFQFPFVRAVGVSGSLSKNFADNKADIDFFIITKASRLWIARTMMHLYKKLTFITGRQHLFCMNYYIDEKALLLEEKNIFTATELKTLLPVSGEKTMSIFFTANKWADAWLPACSSRLQEKKDSSTSWLKSLGEWLFAGNTGNRLDDYLLAATSRRWKKKEQDEKKNSKGLVMGLITDKHFAKSDPGNFQQKVLSLYQQKMNGFIPKENISPDTISSVV